MTKDDPEKGLLRRLISSVALFTRRSSEKAPAPRCDIPWTEPLLPLREARLALVTTGGVHLQTDPPFDTDDAEGDPGYREIPLDAPRELLRITPYYYDHGDAETDLNLVLPIERLKEFRQAQVIGALHDVAYSLMGQVSGSHLQELQQHSAAEIARDLATGGVNYVLLVPA